MRTRWAAMLRWMRSGAAALAVLGLLLAGCEQGWRTDGTSGATKKSKAAAAADRCLKAMDQVPTDAAPLVPEPLTGGRLKLHEADMEVARVGGVRVLFLGDSITHGWEGAGKAVWDAEFAPRGAANFGIPADRTEHVLWRLDQGLLDGLLPETVVLMIGTNNLKSGDIRSTPVEVAAGVRAIVRSLKKRLPDARILLMSILPRQPKYDWIDQAVRDTNACLAAIPGVEFVDIADRFRNDDGTIRESLYVKDLLHLGPEGYRVWADALRGKLDAKSP